MKAHRRDQRVVLTDAAIDSMQNATVPTDQIGSRYGLGWWIEDDRFGYRSALAQGGNAIAQAWLRMIPSERVAVVVLVNRGVGFPSSAVDMALAAVLPKYADGIAKARTVAAASATPPAVPKMFDSTATGRWTGAVYAAGGKVPVSFVIDSTGRVRATIGTRTDSGTARIGEQLVIRLPGDLEVPNSAGVQRQISLYLRPYNAGWGGVATVHPPNATGTDGRVSYWMELKRP
jgi:hypothetical protein